MRSLIKAKALLGFLVFGVLVVALACGPAATPTLRPTATPTRISEPAATPTVAAPTATPTVAAPTATPTTAPAAGPKGTLTVVVPDVGTPLFTNGKGAYPVNRYHWAFGITETPTTLEPVTHKFLPMVADSWELAPDLSKVTLKIHPGIKFNNWNPQWGDAEVTAEDVAYSYNDAGADNSASVHDDAGEYADMYNKWVALDKYTAQGPVDKYRFDILYFSIIQGGSAPSISTS